MIQLLLLFNDLRQRVAKGLIYCFDRVKLNGLFAKSFLLWAYIAAYALCANYHIVKQDTDIAVFPVEKSA